VLGLRKVSSREGTEIEMLWGDAVAEEVCSCSQVHYLACANTAGRQCLRDTCMCDFTAVA
jgi:hypothetical protein